ncbi:MULTISPECIES: hypothetical protein [Bacillus cereus group]|nr:MULTISPECIES: hypothetical protein [Bacillus cereus group]
MKIPEMILNLFDINQAYEIVTIDEHTCEPIYTHKGTVVKKDEESL